MTEAYRAQSRIYAGALESLAADLAAALLRSKRYPDARLRQLMDARRRQLMKDTLEKHRGEGFETVTLLRAVSGSLIVGYGYAQGFAMTKGGGRSSRYMCKEVAVHAFTAGVSAGVAVGTEIGLWKGDFTALAGETNGMQSSLSLVVLFGQGIHWAVGSKDPTGITILGGVGGIDIGTEYVHGWTNLGQNKNCDELKW